MQITIHHRLCLAGCLLAAIGCEASPPPAATGPAGATATEAPTGFAGRLDAAKGIADDSQRNDALALLARDAADAGDATIVDRALTAMTDVSLKDKASASAALRLARGGKTDAAAATAKAISSINLRDGVNAKIAKGDFTE